MKKEKCEVCGNEFLAINDKICDDCFLEKNDTLLKELELSTKLLVDTVNHICDPKKSSSYKRGYRLAYNHNYKKHGEDIEKAEKISKTFRTKKYGDLYLIGYKDYFINKGEIIR